MITMITMIVVDVAAGGQVIVVTIPIIITAHETAVMIVIGIRVIIVVIQIAIILVVSQIAIVATAVEVVGNMVGNC